MVRGILVALLTIAAAMSSMADSLAQRAVSSAGAPITLSAETAPGWRIGAGELPEGGPLASAVEQDVLGYLRSTSSRIRYAAATAENLPIATSPYYTFEGFVTFAEPGRHVLALTITEATADERSRNIGWDRAGARCQGMIEVGNGAPIRGHRNLSATHSRDSQVHVIQGSIDIPEPGTYQVRAAVACMLTTDGIWSDDRRQHGHRNRWFTNLEVGIASRAPDGAQLRAIPTASVRHIPPRG